MNTDFGTVGVSVASFVVAAAVDLAIVARIARTVAGEVDGGLAAAIHPVDGAPRAGRSYPCGIPSAVGTASSGCRPGASHDPRPSGSFGCVCFAASRFTPFCNLAPSCRMPLFNVPLLAPKTCGKNIRFLLDSVVI